MSSTILNQSDGQLVEKRVFKITGNRGKYEVTFTLDTVSSVNVDGLNTLRPGQNGRYFADDLFKGIFLNKKC